MPESTNIVLQRQIDRLNAGDKAAREALIESACGRLRDLTHRMFRDYKRLRPYAETDDVLQSALLRLWRALETVPVATPVEFVRLASSQIRRELIDQVRHYYGPEGSAANRGEIPSGESASQFEPSAPVTNSNELIAWQEFHEFVERLPPDDRVLVDLLWYQEWIYADVAELLQCSVSTIRRRWLELRLRLIPLLPGRVPEP